MTNSKTINVRGQLIDLSEPQVMGILNATPDSFYEGSRVQTEYDIAERANKIIEEGGTMIDIGAFSTRPCAAEVSEKEEMERLRMALKVVRHEQPKAVVSIDTFRPDVARMCVEEYGADIINDVSEGGITGIANVALQQVRGDVPEIFNMVAKLNVPYILMSVQSNIQTMLKNAAEEVLMLRSLGVKDIIFDPGFGFGKTLDDNYKIMSQLEKLQVLDLPLLIGLSRKSMITRLLGIDTSHALNGTTVLNTIALMRGASVLRVHDVREAVEATALVAHSA